jgi:hypothetical protein
LPHLRHDLGTARTRHWCGFCRNRKFRNIDTLIIDKTGTLTEGKPAFDRAALRLKRQ